MTALVLGASGFLGSHVTRKLVEDGQDVRVLLRKTSSTKAIDDLDIERHYGGLFDDDALRAAMMGCDVIYYCVVDARYWLRDPAPLFQTNVEGLRNVLDIAREFPGLRKFVFTSTIGTLAINDSRPVTEEDPHNWSGGGPYIESRVAAEELLFSYVRDRGLPGVALCISTTFGPGDWQPTPHGSMISLVTKGKLPVVPGFSLEVVGIEDAARAMLLAAERGRVGERYIISDRYMSTREVVEIAAAAAGVRPPRIIIPVRLMYAVSFLNDLAARLLRRDFPMAMAGTRISDSMSPLDHGKAERELGWKPEPVEASLAREVDFFLAH
ncbi:MAG TPA: NAD-dependent epimerase/dehydratase family protein [Mycobacterium sp.]|nr:NAD-dependent epimerase/dehydratase family protein [Mycobacterium sp.]